MKRNSIKKLEMLLVNFLDENNRGKCLLLGLYIYEINNDFPYPKNHTVLYRLTPKFIFMKIRKT